MNEQQVSAASGSPSDVTVVMSVYNPPVDLVERVGELRAQCGVVVVVDDGSHTVDDMPQLREVAKVISLEHNSGIATALNAGIEAAQGLGAAFVLTMDQDSKLSQGYVRQALQTWHAAQAAGIKPGLVSASTHNGTRMPRWGSAGGFDELFDPMQSGTLISVATLREVGPFDESLFIDCVDTDYNIRLRRAGFALIGGEGCDLQHALGEARPLRVLGWQPKLRGKPMEILYHAPFRTYYITRNNTVLRKRYRREDGRWMFRRQLMEVESAIVCLVYGPERRKHLHAMWKGWKDAHQGRAGRISDTLSSQLR